jgi:uncharacterized protein YdeI (YjbR/CyaY-like superfamily)
MEDERLSVYFSKRSEWRNWLRDNFDKENEVWLIIPKKSSGKKRIPYNDTVEEALCFGWIDSTVKTLDNDHTMQRFTPRKPRSSYSQANKERLRWIADKNMIHPDIKKEVDRVLSEIFVFPNDILDAIMKDKTAWDNFQNFSDSYKRIRIAYIDSARNRPEEFNKRLRNLIEKTRAKKLVSGYGGIDKYY